MVFTFVCARQFVFCWHFCCCSCCFYSCFYYIASTLWLKLHRLADYLWKKTPNIRRTTGVPQVSWKTFPHDSSIYTGIKHGMCIGMFIIGVWWIWCFDEFGVKYGFGANLDMWVHIQAGLRFDSTELMGSPISIKRAWIKKYFIYTHVFLAIINTDIIKFYSNWQFFFIPGFQFKNLALYELSL